MAHAGKNFFYQSEASLLSTFLMTPGWANGAPRLHRRGNRCHMVLALQSGFGNFANQMPCSLLNFSGFSSVLQREVVKSDGNSRGNHLRAPLSSPRTFQIDVNKLKKQSSQFCPLLHVKFDI